MEIGGDDSARRRGATRGITILNAANRAREGETSGAAAGRDPVLLQEDGALNIYRRLIAGAVVARRACEAIGGL